MSCFLDISLFSSTSSPSSSSSTSSPPHRLAVAPLDLLPVDHFPERRDVVRALVLICEIVRMLPHVEPEDRYAAASRDLFAHERGILIRGRTARRRPAVDNQPRPARAEAVGSGIVECFLECIEPTERA